jgi:uncharacterized protein YbbC (DUF1343 family)
MVRSGLERFISDAGSYRNRNIGLIANHTSVTIDLAYSWDILTRSGLNIKKVFSPEHGLFGAEQDQVPVGIQPRFPFRAVSLYGNSAQSLSPLKSHLEDIDLVIFDIQDIGARYYTYLNTMVLFMQAIGSTDIEFIVLDRPNPMGGISVEGPLPDRGYESFVGLLPVPVRHGLTAGEMALLAQRHFALDLDLKIIRMEGWRREMMYQDTGLAWIPPSPNMPTINTAFVYPGTCLLEGTNASEGRGTTTPFEMVGAPGVDPYLLSGELNSLRLPGAYFRPVFFRPVSGKHCGALAGGVFIHVKEHRVFKPFCTGMATVSLLRCHYSEFEFVHGTYEFNAGHPAFDLLAGGPSPRKMIESGTQPGRIEGAWEADENDFLSIKEGLHLYRH